MRPRTRNRDVLTLSNDTSVINKRNSSEKCRVCLDNNGEIPIFGNNNLSKNLTVFGGVKVSEDDNLPQYLCDECYTLLDAAILFRKTAKKSDKLLRQSTNLYNVFEESDHLSESELSIKREYLEFDCNSDSELMHFDIDNINQEFESDNESVGLDSDNIDYSMHNKEEYKSAEEQSNYDVDKDTVMIIVGDKDKENELKTVCEKCNVTFKTIEELHIHNKKSHPEVPPNHRKCEVCHKFVKIISYNAHLKEHRDNYREKHDKKYSKVECEICGKKISKAYLKYHAKLHVTTEEKARRHIECQLCKKSFSVSYFQDHMKRIHDKNYNKNNTEENEETEFKQCPICDKLIEINTFKLHLSKHGGIHRRLICDQCGKEFKRPSAFKTHCLTHGSELKYKCQFCPYRGLHQALLKIHVRTHTGDYNYKCTECPARFITKSNLSKHLQRHKGEYGIKCNICQKGFYSKRDLDKHTKSVHLDLKNHVCNICGKGYGHRDNMLSHQLKVHKREKIIAKGRLPSYLKVQQNPD